MTQRTGRKDVVGISSLNVDYFYESEDLSFLEPFYPEGGYRRQWVLTDSKEIEKLKIILKEKARLISKTGGGSGANTVYGLAKMGFQSGIVGKIGRDAEERLIPEKKTLNRPLISYELIKGLIKVQTGK